MMADTLKDSALDYHRLPQPRTFAVVPAKRPGTRHDMALAHKCGVPVAMICSAVARYKRHRMCVPDLVDLARAPRGNVDMSAFAVASARNVAAASSAAAGAAGAE